MVWEDLYCDKVWQFSIFLSCMVLGESYGEPLLRDCSLFMAKGGVGDFQPIQAYEKFTPPRKWVFEKITPRLCESFKIVPPPPPLPSRRDVFTIVKLRTTCVLATCR